jgi:hypothetical protein
VNGFRCHYPKLQASYPVIALLSGQLFGALALNRERHLRLP